MELKDKTNHFSLPMFIKNKYIINTFHRHVNNNSKYNKFNYRILIT